MRRSRKFFIFSLLDALALGLLTFNVTKDEFYKTSSSAHTHSGYHYLAKDKTCTSSGNREFWACCECHEQFLSEPDGDFVNMGQYNEELPSNHIAYIPGGHEFEAEELRYDLIGAYKRKCKVCKLYYDGESLMDESLIDLKSYLYGASIIPSDQAGSSKSSCTSGANGITYTFSNPDKNDSFMLNLPKVQYSKYSLVVFNLNIYYAYFNLGSDASNVVYMNLDNKDVEVRVQKDYLGNVNATLNIPSSSNTKNTEVIFPLKMTDNIKKGIDSLSIFVNNAIPDSRIIHLNDVSIETVCEHDYVGRADDIIGTTSKVACKKCGLSRDISRDTVSEDIDFSYNNHGVSISYIGTMGWHKNDDSSASIWSSNTKSIFSSNRVTFKLGIDGANYKIALPRINYTKYEVVQFPITMMGPNMYYGLSFTNPSVWSEFTNTTNTTYKDGMLTIRIVSSDTLDITYEWSIYSKKETIKNSDVLNGLSSLMMYFSSGTQSDFYLSRPIFNYHAHTFKEKYSSLGGDVEVVCEECGYSQDLREFANSDLNYEKTLFGASGNDLFNVNVEHNNLKYTPKVNASYAIASTLSLPRINFNYFKNLQFDIISNIQYSLQFTKFTYDDGVFHQKILNNTPLSLTITTKDSLITARISNGYIEDNITISDEDIFNGVTPICLYCRCGELTDYFTVSLPTELSEIDGKLVPEFKSSRDMIFSAYSTPYVTLNNNDEIFKDLSNAGFNHVTELLNGRDSYCGDFYNKVNQYASNSISFQELKPYINSTIDACYNSSLPSIDAANKYNVLYDALIGSLYDLKDHTDLSNSQAKEIYDYIFDYIKTKYSSILSKINGFNLWDEPNTKTYTSDKLGIGRTKTMVTSLYDSGLSVKGFVNLLPIYASNGGNQNTYRNYINYYIDNVAPYTNYNGVSFDQYAQVNDNGSYYVDEYSLWNYYAVANAIRQKNENLELNSFVHCLDKAESKRAEIRCVDDLRFQIYQAMAFGSTRVTFFEYFSINSSIDGNPKAIITATNDGGYTKTPLYNYAKEAITEAQYLFRVYGDFKWKGYKFCGDIYDFKPLYNIKDNQLTSSSLSSVTNSSAEYTSYLPTLVGCFSNGNKEGFLVMNYQNPSPTNTAWAYETTLTFNNNPSHALIYLDGAKQLMEVHNNKLSFSIGGTHAAFVVPLNLN